MSIRLTKALRPLLLTLFFALAACQGQKSFVAQAPAVKTEGGTDNTGGGSGAQGKTFDDYIEKNLMGLPGFQKVVQPIYEKLKVENPSLAADFFHIIHQREWYFVPGPVNKISEQIIGAYSRSEQYALQDLNKVWVDRELFNAMNDSAQGNLILHEIIMGIRLLQHQDKMDLCIAKASEHALSESTLPIYKEKKYKCRRSFPRVPGFENQKFKLNQNDYDLIRKIVSLLDRSQPDVEDVVSLLESHGIRKYIAD